MLDPGHVMCGGGDFLLNRPSFPENLPTAVGMLGRDLLFNEDESWLAAAAEAAAADAAAAAAAYCCEAKSGGPPPPPGPPRLRKGLFITGGGCLPALASQG